MLNTERITRAFDAICEEAEKLKQKDLPEIVQKGLGQIISIAKHQSDVRSAKAGSCKSERGQSE